MAELCINSGIYVAPMMQSDDEVFCPLHAMGRTFPKRPLGTYQHHPAARVEYGDTIEGRFGDHLADYVRSTFLARQNLDDGIPLDQLIRRRMAEWALASGWTPPEDGDSK